MNTQQEELYQRAIEIRPELKGHTDLYIKLSKSKKNYVVHIGNEQILIPADELNGNAIKYINNELKTAVYDYGFGISVCFTRQKGGEIRMSGGAFVKFEYPLTKELPAAKSVLEKVLLPEILIQLLVAKRLGLTGEVVGQPLFRTRQAEVFMGYGKMEYRFKKYFEPVLVSFDRLFSGKKRMDIEKEVSTIQNMEDLRRRIMERSADWQMKLSTKKKQIPGIFSADEHFPDRVIFADPLFCGSDADEDLKDGPVYRYDLREDILYYRERCGEVTVRSKKDTEVQLQESYIRFLKMQKHKNFAEAAAMIEALKKDGIRGVAGKGLLNPGVTKVSYRDIFMDIRVKSWRTSFTEWKESISRILHLCCEKQKEYEADAARHMYEQYREFFDDPLGLAIVDCVAKNEQYITENAVTSILRDTCVQLNMKVIRGCKYEGMFNSLKEDDVKNCIRQMIHDKFFREVECKGTYGRYNILKLAEIGEFYRSHISEIMDWVQDTWKATLDCQMMQKYWNGEGLNEQDYVQLLDMCEHPRKHTCLLVIHAETYFEMFEKAPETVIQLLSMKKILEEDKTKLKLYRQIEKAYKKGRKKS